MSEPAHRHRERERSYVADRPDAKPELSSLGPWTQPHRVELCATYYDTPDLALSRAGWSLRRRTGGTDAGWHLKSPAVGDTREELQLPGEGGLPAPFRERVTELTGTAPLVPMVVLETTRWVSVLTGVQGERRAELCIDAVSARVGALTSRWDEVEVELDPAEAESTLDEAEAALLASGYLRAPQPSKVRRALADHLAAPRETLGPRSTAERVVSATVERQVGALQSWQDGLRTPVPRAVHQSRVAMRRLRSVLRSFGPTVGLEAADLIGEIRWWGEVLGAPRDAEVMGARLAALGEDESIPAEVGAAIAHAVTRLAEVSTQAHARLLTELAGERRIALDDALAALVAELALRPPGPLAHDLLGEPLRADLARAGRRYARVLRHPDDLERWHRLRKSAKAVRADAEALREAFGAPAERMAEAWEQVTEHLGAVQDTVVMADFLTDLAAAEHQRAGLRRLIKHERNRRRTELKAARRALDAALALEVDWLE